MNNDNFNLDSDDELEMPKLNLRQENEFKKIVYKILLKVMNG